MEQYGRFEKDKPLVLRIGSGKVDEDQRLLMMLPESVFGSGLLSMPVTEGLAKVIRDLTDEQASKCLLNEDERGAITTAPLQSARDILYDGQGIKRNVYIASASPNGAPRVHPEDRLGQHVAFVEEGTQAYNLLNLVVNTEKDTQGYF